MVFGHILNWMAIINPKEEINEAKCEKTRNEKDVKIQCYMFNLTDGNVKALDKHTFNLSFLLHGQDFWKPNFTPKKTTKDTKNTKNFSEKVKCMQFFHPIWKNLHLTEIFYTGTACDACDKLKVCPMDGLGKGAKKTKKSINDGFMYVCVAHTSYLSQASQAAPV